MEVAAETNFLLKIYSQQTDATVDWIKNEVYPALASGLGLHLPHIASII